MTDPFLAWRLLFVPWPVWLLCLMHGASILGDPSRPWHGYEEHQSHAENEKAIRVHGVYRGPRLRRE